LQFRLWCKASGLRVQRIFVLEYKIVGKSWKILIQVHD
jgi:hypothetical protein